MSVRVYVPSTLSRLSAVVAAGEIAPAPFAAHAVTAAVREALGDAPEEDGEYAAASAAALASVGLLTDQEPARRVVLAVDVPSVREAEGEDPTLVHVDEPASWRRVAAVLVDDREAEALVRAARGSRTDERLLERCLDHELGWWATQEVPDLVESLLADLGEARRP